MVERGVVTESEVVRGEIGFHQWGVVDCHFHDVQDVEPMPVLVLGDSEKLLDGTVNSLGLSVSLGMKGA